MPTPFVVPLFGRVTRPLQRFLAHEASGGALLFACAVAALVLANSDYAPMYASLQSMPIHVGVGDLALHFDVAALVNDGLMSIFFFVVGLEIKRELVSGELRTLQRALLPAIAALGGMVVPALVYASMNGSGPGERGWGVPMATDIAFVIGCLSLLKGRVSSGLAVFVVALAIFDDMGGIVVIALRYGSGIAWAPLGIAGLTTALLVLLNRLKVAHWAPYTIGGIALWVAFHHGGVHATISGVILGLAVPAKARRSPAEVLRELREYLTGLSCENDTQLKGGELAHIEERIEELGPPLERFIYTLHPVQVYLIMPVFAFINAGVDVRGFHPADLLTAVPLGIALGLFAGKQVGIFAATFMAVKLKIAQLPSGATWWSLYGVSVLAGIGFTVALFIAELAFVDEHALALAKVGTLVGSLASGVVGYLLLRFTVPRTANDSAQSASH